MTTARARVAPLGLAAVAVVPFAAAAVRAVVDRWYPVGDDALYAIRALDVLTEHHPLLGTWSSASQSTGVDVNHPGPLVFDLLAVPVRIHPTAGIPVAMAALNAGAVVGSAWVARRIGGARVGVAVLAAASLLAWSLGSQMLVDPWQPNAMMLPYLLFLVLTWACWAAGATYLPAAVAVGSLLVQTHLSYIVVVPALLGASVVVAVLRARRASSRAPTDGARSAPWWIGAAVLVGLALWAQPLAEQVANGRDGNLVRLAETRGGDEERAGIVLGARLVAGVLTDPPLWSRGSYGDTYAPAIRSRTPSASEAAASGVPSVTAAAFGLVLLGAVLAAALVHARRRGDHVVATGLVLAMAALVIALLNASIQPINPVLGLGGHQVAWLWPTGALVAAALATVVPRRALAPVAAAVVVVAALGAALVPGSAGMGPRRYQYAEPVMRELAPQLDRLPDGTYLFEPTGLQFGEPYSAPVLFELRRRGVEVVLDDPVLVRQLGERRARRGPVDGRLQLRLGDAARAPLPPGTERVAEAGAGDEAVAVLLDPGAGRGARDG